MHLFRSSGEGRFFVSLSPVKGEALFGEISVFLMLIRAAAVHHAEAFAAMADACLKSSAA